MEQELDDESIDLICITSGSQYFDEVIGHIEDIVLSTEFEGLQENFMETYWRNFENTEENKLEYMDIFNKYTTLFENYLMNELKQRMPNFDMKRFAKELEENNVLISPQDKGEIFELLYSLSNFEAFKDIILDYRSKMEGYIGNLNFDFLTTKSLEKLRVEEHIKLCEQETENTA